MQRNAYRRSVRSRKTTSRLARRSRRSAPLHPLRRPCSSNPAHPPTRLLFLHSPLHDVSLLACVQPPPSPTHPVPPSFSPPAVTLGTPLLYPDCTQFLMRHNLTDEEGGRVTKPAHPDEALEVDC